MDMTASVKRFLALLLVFSIAQYGCVSRQLAPTIVSYNLAVESAQNNVLLLNTIRAEKHLPMYLTDISTINGSIRRDLTATVALPFGHLLHHADSEANDTAAAVSNGLATPGATYSVNPTFTFNVLNTQDFMRGFLKPVSIETLAFYWGQAYPPELLLHLFVLEVDVLDAKNHLKARYHNHPQIPPYTNAKHPQDINHDLRCFGQWVSWFVQGAHFETAPEKLQAVGPPLGTNDFHLDDLLEVAEASDVTLTKQGGSFQLESKPQKELMLVSPQSEPFPQEAACTDTELDETAPAPGSATLEGRTSLGQSHDTVRFHLRSPEGIIYYLGQLSRLLHHTGQVARLRLDGYDELSPIFVVLERNPTAPSPKLRCGSLVETTDAQGDSYFIPAYPKLAAVDDRTSDYLAPLAKCDPGVSMISLNIVSQLIGLQKAAKDFPSTGVVRAIVQ
jgi:hypothetical protein